MHFNCLFFVAVDLLVMHLEGDIVLLVEHLDKCTRHEAFHQTLFAVHVILVDGWAFGNEDDLQSEGIIYEYSWTTLYSGLDSPHWRWDSIPCDPLHRTSTERVRAAFDPYWRAMAWTDLACGRRRHWCCCCLCQHHHVTRQHWTCCPHPVDLAAHTVSGLPSWEMQRDFNEDVMKRNRDAN